MQLIFVPRFVLFKWKTNSHTWPDVSNSGSCSNGLIANNGTVPGSCSIGSTETYTIWIYNYFDAVILF
jgi:hypothetical protein